MSTTDKSYHFTIPLEEVNSAEIILTVVVRKNNTYETWVSKFSSRPGKIQAILSTDKTVCKFALWQKYVSLTEKDLSRGLVYYLFGEQFGR